MKFVDRQREVKALRQIMASEEAELLILYGRRRVGKTRLLTYFIEQEAIDTPFYWMATTQNSATQLRDFSQHIYRYDPRFPRPPAKTFSYSDWEEAFQQLGDIATQRETSTLFVLDEFSYILRNDPSITSILQRVWDHQLSQIPQLKMILTGSLIGMMQREIFSYQAPLYGRATSQIRLRPLPYGALVELFPQRDAMERMAIYAVTGGVPAYIERFTRRPTFTRALKEVCLETGSIMLSDPALILNEQLSDPQTYESILSTIAWGFHQWKDIAKMTGVSETSLGHFLKTLIELELIERRDPVLAKPTGKRGRYYLSDPFLRFYYRFIVPNLAPIDRGNVGPVVDKLTSELRAFIGTHVFEYLAKEWVWSAAMTDKLPFQPSEVGSYWRVYRGEGVQLDVVATNKREKQLLIGECKWGAGKVGVSVLNDLMRRSQRMPQVKEGWQTTYALFAREGFSQVLVEEAEREGVMLITADNLEQQLLETMN